MEDLPTIKKDTSISLSTLCLGPSFSSLLKKLPAIAHPYAEPIHNKITSPVSYTEGSCIVMSGFLPDQRLNSCNMEI